jgi:hypothetical protein
MKHVALSILAGMALFGACVHSSQSDAPSQQDSSSVSNPFFPVADYLESEIRMVDSTPTAIWKFVTHQNRTDTSFIGVAEFNSLALHFLPPEIRNNGWEQHFTETSFADRATKSITFTYSPKDPHSVVQRVDVTTTQGLRAQEVRSIYIEQQGAAGDSLILRKMLWKSKIGFQIVTLIRAKGKKPEEQQLRVAWGKETDDDE